MSSEVSTVPRPDVDRTITYSTPWNAASGRCRLRVWWDRRTIVVSEIDDNPGMSVTNAAEYVAQAVEATLAVRLDAPDAPALIEHYPPAAHRGHTIDRVRFSHRVEGRLSGPFWKPAHATHGWLFEALS